MALSATASLPGAYANPRDGNQRLRLLYESRTQCRSIKVGDYAEADGEKLTELLFDAHNLMTSR